MTGEGKQGEKRGRGAGGSGGSGGSWGSWGSWGNITRQNKFDELLEAGFMSKCYGNNTDISCIFLQNCVY
ncbi:hypothetical protein AA650_24375 [Anabaena sp. WA102]|nr:hypothetical protein AA650_24375 [Anabaena sp. WA102]OBQ17344.1 MAG: hypothetical protein AN486_15435 [Anabaena sp. AL93]